MSNTDISRCSWSEVVQPRVEVPVWGRGASAGRRSSPQVAAGITPSEGAGETLAESLDGRPGSQLRPPRGPRSTHSDRSAHPRRPAPSLRRASRRPASHSCKLAVKQCARTMRTDLGSAGPALAVSSRLWRREADRDEADRPPTTRCRLPGSWSAPALRRRARPCCDTRAGHTTCQVEVDPPAGP